MLEKPKPMTKRLPAIVVPDEMLSELSKISETERLTLSETIRQGLLFFLSNYVNEINVKVNENNREEAS
jgi:hypothetical protein